MIDPALRVPTSAVVWIPPESFWEPIQEIRRRFDRHLHRWMPHLTLLYPFRPPEQFETVMPLLQEACAGLAPFESEFLAVRSFEHSPRSFTLWLAPEPESAFRGLQAALQARFPDCDEIGQYPGGFTPHLSLGQSHDPRELAFRLEEIRRRWTPMRTKVDEIAIIARTGENPFVVDRRIPLGPRGT